MRHADQGWYEDPVRAEAASMPRRILCRSLYLTMRDGVQLAADLYLPAALGAEERLPTILRQTRYGRSMRLRRPFRWILGEHYDHRQIYAKIRRLFVGRGYAWLDLDVRGSGASTGRHLFPWSPDEVRDGAEVVDWIVGHEWSNGNVGTLGCSYDGTAAEFLLVNRHPAVKAAAPMFTLFDTYTDIAFPGGIRATWFIEHWDQVNRALDQSALHRLKWWLWPVVDGVQPVAGDLQREMLRRALRDHAANQSVNALTGTLTFRDDLSSLDPYHDAAGRLAHEQLAGHPSALEGSIGVSSPHHYRDDFFASNAAIYCYSGWFDGAYQSAAIRRFLTVRNNGCRLILGPWNHGGRINVSPEAIGRAQFDHGAELLRFFDLHLIGRDTGIASERPVHYFTMVAEEWRTADTWPPPEVERLTLYFAAEHQLKGVLSESEQGHDSYQVDLSTCTGGSGGSTRWKCMIDVQAVIRYPDRTSADRRLLTYTSSPLDDNLEVTGAPVVKLFVASSSSDGQFFVYLEDVDESGHVTYVTEGLLRAVHRHVDPTPSPIRGVQINRSFLRRDAAPMEPEAVTELTFELFDTSYLFRRGHRLRVALAGADISHFAPLPGPAPRLEIQRTTRYPSQIVLPVMPQARRVPSSNSAITLGTSSCSWPTQSPRAAGSGTRTARD